MLGDDFLDFLGRRKVVYASLYLQIHLHSLSVTFLQTLFLYFKINAYKASFNSNKNLVQLLFAHVHTDSDLEG